MASLTKAANLPRVSFLFPQMKFSQLQDEKEVMLSSWNEGIQRIFKGFSDKILDWLAKVDQERVRMIFGGR